MFHNFYLCNLSSKGMNQRVNISTMVKFLQLFCFVCEFIQINSLFSEKKSVFSKKSRHLFVTFQNLHKMKSKFNYLQQQKRCKILGQFVFYCVCPQFCLSSSFYFLLGSCQLALSLSGEHKCGS